MQFSGHRVNRPLIGGRISQQFKPQVRVTGDCADNRVIGNILHRVGQVAQFNAHLGIKVHSVGLPGNEQISVLILERRHNGVLPLSGVFKCCGWDMNACTPLAECKVFPSLQGNAVQPEAQEAFQGRRYPERLVREAVHIEDTVQNLTAV